MFSTTKRKWARNFLVSFAVKHSQLYETWPNTERFMLQKHTTVINVAKVSLQSIICRPTSGGIWKRNISAHIAENSTFREVAWLIISGTNTRMQGMHVPYAINSWRTNVLWGDMQSANLMKNKCVSFKDVKSHEPSCTVKKSKKFKCGSCGETFVEKTYLTRHVKNKHEMPNVYSCAFGKTYKYMFSFKRLFAIAESNF